MPFTKRKHLTRSRQCSRKSKSGKEILPLLSHEIQDICITDTAENLHNGNNKRKGISLSTRSATKDYISIEIKDERSDNMEQQINVEKEIIVKKNEGKLNSIEVPKCLNKKANLDCTSETFSRRKIAFSDKCNKSEMSAVKMRDTSVLATSSNDSTSITHNLFKKDYVNLINNKSVPDKNKNDSQQGKVNDCIASNNFSKLPTSILKSPKTKKIENKVSPLSTTSPRSLPSDLKAIKDNDEKKSRLVKTKLPSSMQSFTQKVQSMIRGDTNESKSTEKYMELSTKSRISSQKDTNKQKVTNENSSKTNAAHQNSGNEMDVKNSDQNLFPVVPIIKRKRGRPRKGINDSTDQNVSSKSVDDDTSQNIFESTTRDKKRISKVTFVGVSDSSSESDIAEDNIFVKKKGRPPNSGRSQGHSRGRGRRRGRGRSPGRGRGRGRASQDTEYIPKLAKDGPQLRKKESDDFNKIDNTDTVAVANNENPATDLNASNKNIAKLVTCGKCDQEIPKKQWSLHKLNQHNNMAWQKDEEPLDFENDELLLKRVLTLALKQKKKYLTCEQCGNTKRSVIGFISHIQFCGKSEQEKQALMVTCSICNAVMMPSSVEVHDRLYHRQSEENKSKEADIQVEKTKRKAAERAVPKILEVTKSLKDKNVDDAIQMSKRKKIPNIWKVMWKKELASKNAAACKQAGCTFASSSYEDICEHYYQCNFMPKESFICKICKFSTNSKDEIANHITEAHSSNNDLDKCSDYEIEENETSSDESTFEGGIKRKLRRSSKTNFDSTKITPSLKSAETYGQSLRWSLDFELKNYELALFKNDMPNCFTLLGDNDAVTYLPEVTVSMAFKRIDINSPKNIESSKNDNWKQINRFESDICEGVSTFFVGGPIWALAWLPIPSAVYHKNPSQYIAISTHPTMESVYTVGNKYSGPNIIQIWDVGPLSHEANGESRLPVLAYAIAHNSGTVWCLEWCPSGCYQDSELGNYEVDKNKSRRMGLLAAACSDGCINIYSLPFTDELKFKKTEFNSRPIYKTDPVMTLVVNTRMYDNSKQDWQCTKLSWTKENGHSIIGAGFSNGYIGLWDLTTTSPLLFAMRKNTKFIDTFKHFFAHHNTITMIALFPHGKSRYLASASVDKSYKFWDLEDTGAPQMCAKKGIVSNGTWMTHWPCAVLSFDDAVPLYAFLNSAIERIRI
ncbi:uncharacterized protein [Cardiocondyla obscurior]|uniref:uncharacterized protein isoform X2 n=1 Tax=Cardiocondyla obscurior TaxID=286306 RepID=UPI0039657FD0